MHYAFYYFFYYYYYFTCHVSSFQTKTSKQQSSRVENANKEIIGIVKLINNSKEIDPLKSHCPGHIDALWIAIQNRHSVILVKNGTDRLHHFTILRLFHYNIGVWSVRVFTVPRPAAHIVQARKKKLKRSYSHNFNISWLRCLEFIHVYFLNALTSL